MRMVKIREQLKRHEMSLYGTVHGGLWGRVYTCTCTKPASESARRRSRSLGAIPVPSTGR
jgi:hypothetical protein